MMSKMASCEYSVRHVSIVWFSIFFWASLVLTTPGVLAFKFLSLPPNPPFYSRHFGLNVDINCTTDDPNATVTLLHRSSTGSLSERPLSPSKLILNQQVFTVLNLVTNDAGAYSCKATDQSGKTIQWQGFIILLIHPLLLPKHFVLRPAKAIIVLEGQSGSVTCESEGASTVTLKWERNITGSGSYQPVPESQVKVIKDTSADKLRAILQITNARLSDSGTYKCTVKVQHLSMSRLMTIRIEAPTAPTIEPYLGSLLVQEGEQKIVKCEAKGSPKPNVTWYREGKQIDRTECGKYPKDCEGIAYEVYEEGETSPQHTPWTIAVLKIRSALYPRDQGEFKCVASNGNLPSPEKTFTFDVQAPPKIYRRNNQAVARYQKEEDKETQVSCSVEKGNPLPTFKWDYQAINCPELDNNCKPLEDQWNPVPLGLLTSPAAKQTNKSNIRVKSDQGNTFYRCQANNSLGNDSYLIMFVRVASGTRTVEVDSRTKSKFNEGSTLKMYCIDRSYGFDKVHFTKDGKRLLPGDDPLGDDPRVNITHEQKAEEEDRAVLSVKNLTLNDSGNYQCVMELDPSEFGSINITVKKLIAPNITGLVDQRVLQKMENGDSVLLKCIVSGNPLPTITWYFDRNGQGEREIVTDPGSGLDNNLYECKKRHSGFFFLRKNDPSHLVICSPDYEKQQGRYHCHAKNIAGEMNKSAFVDIEMEPHIEEPKEGYTVSPQEIGDTLNLTCKAKGNPAPNVTWIKNSTTEIVAKGQTNSNQLLVESMKVEDFGLYTCVASNKLGRTVVSVEVEKAVVTPLAQKDLSTGTLVGITVGVSLFVVIILVVCCVLYRRQKKQIDEYKQLYFLQQSDYKIDPDRSLLEQCNDLPYDPDWEFPEERLLLGNILGAGAFGQVMQAEAIGILALNPRDKSAESFKRRSKIRRSSRAKELKKEEGSGGWKNVKIPVAVKTLKEGASREEYKDLASELKILIHLGQHKNIVNLLGACTRGKRLMVIMEFAPHGSLLSFLRGKRDIHEATWTKTMNDPEKEFTLVDLVMTGFQVARGMSFLASRKCVHRDLAARNILVGEDYVMKIADFGLARDIYKDDLYVKKTQGLLPVKWMAPESLFDRIYTEKTDVWSFGILLWEAFTLGGTPYPGLPTEQLLDYLSDGKRMDMPARCPLEVYTIMRDCWIQEPEQRPKFTTLTERLASILEKNTSKDNPYVALQMEEEAQPSQGYYLQPVDDGGIRDSKRYVKSPVHSPTSDTSEPPNFGDAGSAHKGADRMGYDSPLPTLPPGLPVMSDEDIPHDPLPPLPPYETSRSDSAGGESGIDVDAVDDGYVDDARADSPFLPRPGNKPVAIQMDKYNKVPEEKILPKGRHGNYETEL